MRNKVISLSLVFLLQLFSQESSFAKRLDEGVVDGGAARFFSEDLRYAQWGLDAIGLDGVNYTGKGVKIALLSDGLDGRHKDLIGRYQDGYNAVTDKVYKPLSVTGYDGGYEGTFIAGLMAGNDDKLGIKGVAHKATILPVVVDDAGKSSDQIIANGVNWAVSKKVGVIYLNPGIAGTLIDKKANLSCLAIERAYKNGILTFIPSFVDLALNSSVFNLTDCKYAVVVAPIKENLGEIGGGSANSAPDFIAPGSNVLSTSSGNDWYSYRVAKGAFIAPAYAASAAAILIESNIISNVSKMGGARFSKALYERLKVGAVDIGLGGKDVNYGYGLIDVQGSLKGKPRFDKKSFLSKIYRYTIPEINQLETDNFSSGSVSVSWTPPLGVSVKKYRIEGFFIEDNGKKVTKSVVVDGNEVRGILPISISAEGAVRVVAILDNGSERKSAYRNSVEYSPVIDYPPTDATVLSASVSWVEEGILVNVKLLYPEYGWDLLVINADTGEIARKYKVPSGKSTFTILYDINHPARSWYLNIATGVGSNGIDNFLNPYYSLDAGVKSAGKEYAGVWGNAFSNCKIGALSCVGEVVAIKKTGSNEVLAEAVIREDLSFSAVFPWKDEEISIYLESTNGLRSKEISRKLWYRG